MRRRIEKVVLLLVIGATILLAMNLEARAENLTSTGGAGDVLPVKGEYHQDIEKYTVSAQQLFDEIEEIRQKSDIKRSQTYNCEWDRFSTYYYYNSLNSKQKQFWDDLDKVCCIYLLNAVDCGDYTAYVSRNGMTEEEIHTVVVAFLYSNPQYYFLESSYTWSSTGVAIKMYPAFQDSATRNSATNEISTRVNQLMQQVNNQASDVQKVRTIHDILCKNIVYDSYVANGGIITSSYEEQHYTQSVYSALVGGNTVCAGYTKTMGLLCNAYNLDTVATTSDVHAWNKVRVNGSWYNVDTTFADQEWGIVYDYYLKSDQEMCRRDTYGEHLPEDVWNGLLPRCEKNSTASYTDAGTIDAVLGKLPKPKCEVSQVNGAIIARLYTDNSADIYYTLDGTTPGIGYGKSVRYTSEITVQDNTTLRAIAVKDEYGDSDILEMRINGESSANNEFTGMAVDPYGTWRYYVNGVIDYNYTGMACNEYGWWYFTNGQLDWNYTGMALNEYGWWYYRNGQLDWTYTGMACNEYGWWYFTNGQLDWTYTGMALNEYGWWYYRNGQLDWTYTGMACNEYGWWYYRNGQLDWTYTGMACNEYGWWYFTNGQLDWTYTGMALNEYGWWYYTNGRLDWTYTGYGYNEYGRWWYQDGRLVGAA